MIVVESGQLGIAQMGIDPCLQGGGRSGRFNKGEQAGQIGVDRGQGRAVFVDQLGQGTVAQRGGIDRRRVEEQGG